MSSLTYPRLHPLGDAAWIVEFGSSIDEATHERVMGLAQALVDAKAQGQWPTIVEWVPAYTSLSSCSLVQRGMSVVIGPLPQIAPKKHCVPSVLAKWNAAPLKTDQAMVRNARV